MQRFVYKAKAKDGKSREGKVEARDMTSAVGVLRERGMVVVSIHPLSALSGLASITKTFQRVSFDDVVTFTRQLATMVESGLSLTEAFSVLEVQAKPMMAKVVSDVLRDVEGGSSVADAMSKHGRVFGGVYISLVRAGEASGALGEVLTRLAETMEKQKDFRGKIKGAMIYPAIVLIGMLVVTAIMMIFVIPQLAAMYEDFGADLPLSTRLLIVMSGFFVNFWPLVIVLFGGGLFGFRYWYSGNTGKRYVDELLLKVPILGRLRSEIVLAEMARTLSLLLGAGVSLIESLEIVSGVMGNYVYKKAMRGAIRSVKKGVPLSVILARQGVFPPLLPNMISIGEETGKMDGVLVKVATYFEVESEHTVRNLTTALEPLIMIVLGVGVGFLVISIIMPIYNLTSQF